MNIKESLLNDAEVLFKLKDDIHQALIHRHEGESKQILWSNACQNFHKSLGEISRKYNFNGIRDGLTHKNSETIDFIIAFLDADPYFFRSGYLKEYFWHKINGCSLNADQINKLENIAISYISKTMRREFRYMCKAMASIATHSFWERIKVLLSDLDVASQKRANILMSYSKGIAEGDKSRIEFDQEILFSKFPQLKLLYDRSKGSD